MNTHCIQVLVVDDHPIVIGGTRALLDEVEDINVIGEACNGITAIEENKRLKPDVILMDLVMPEMDGIEAIRLITEEQPEAKILTFKNACTLEIREEGECQKSP